MLPFRVHLTAIVQSHECKIRPQHSCQWEEAVSIHFEHYLTV